MVVGSDPYGAALARTGHEARKLKAPEQSVHKVDGDEKRRRHYVTGMLGVGDV